MRWISRSVMFCATCNPHSVTCACQSDKVLTHTSLTSSSLSLLPSTYIVQRNPISIVQTALVPSTISFPNHHGPSISARCRSSVSFTAVLLLVAEQQQEVGLVPGILPFWLFSKQTKLSSAVSEPSFRAILLKIIKTNTVPLLMW